MDWCLDEATIEGIKKRLLKNMEKTLVLWPYMVKLSHEDDFYDSQKIIRPPIMPPQVCPNLQS